MVLELELVLFMCFFENWYWYWNCLYNDRRIGIGTGIVYTMSEELVLELGLFIVCPKNWYELVLELELCKQWQKNWYWYWNCLHCVWRIGIGIGIGYTMSEELVLIGIGIGIV